MATMRFCHFPNKQFVVDDTPEVSTRAVNGWLNEVALTNILSNVVHLGALHVCIESDPPLLKAVALENILFISVTLLTSQSLRG